MSHPIHVNLLLRTEQRSPAPVRARVMVPVAAAFFVGAFSVSAMMLRTRVGSLMSDEMRVDMERERLEPAHRSYLALLAETEDAKAGLKQLGFFRAARSRWGEALTALPDQVPASVQFTLLQYDHPPQPLASPLAPLPAPTNRVETGTVLLRGRASDTEGVATLLDALGKPPFNVVFAKAEIRPGAIRQEVRRNSDEPELLLFDIDVACHPRRFE